jgi:hypothetical protein
VPVEIAGPDRALARRAGVPTLGADVAVVGEVDLAATAALGGFPEVAGVQDDVGELVIPPGLGGLLLKPTVLLGLIAGLFQFLEECGGPSPILIGRLEGGLRPLEAGGKDAEGAGGVDGTSGIEDGLHGDGS